MWNQLRYSNRHSGWIAIWLALLGASGCSTSADSVVRFGLAAPPVTLDPRFATDAAAARIGRLLFESLVDFDDNFQPIPALANWTRITPTHYRVKLRRQSRFHDGAPVTAQDVVATYRAVLAADSKSPHRGALRNIARIEADGPRQVDFHLRRADELFVGLLTLGILRAHEAHREDVLLRPTGSGPFRLEPNSTLERIRLQRVRDGQHIEFLSITNETTRVLKLVRGELDIVQGGISPENARWLAAQPSLQVLTRPGTLFSYIGTNLARGPTRGQEVRTALALALDRVAIVEHLFGGDARLAQSLLVPEHWAGARLAALDFDPEAARRALARAGYSASHPLRLELKTSSDSFRRRLATVLQRQWRAVGIDVTIKSYDWGTFYGDVKAGRFDLYLLSWVGLQLPDIFRQAFHSDSRPPRGANRGGYRSAQADSLIDAAERATQTGTQVAHYQALQLLLLHDLPYLPLWFEDTVIVHRRRVLGYDTNLHAHYDALIGTTLARAYDATTSH